MTKTENKQYRVSVIIPEAAFYFNAESDEGIVSVASSGLERIAKYTGNEPPTSITIGVMLVDDIQPEPHEIETVIPLEGGGAIVLDTIDGHGTGQEEG